MRPIVTDGVTWCVSVSRSVGLSQSGALYKSNRTNRDGFSSAQCGLGLAQKPLLDRGPDPTCEWAILTRKTLSARQKAGWKSKINSSPSLLTRSVTCDTGSIDVTVPSAVLYAVLCCQTEPASAA